MPRSTRGSASRSATRRRLVAGSAAAAVVASSIVMLPTAATAAGPVLPGNESDIGLYTNGASHVMDIGDPTYNYESEVAALLEPGVPYTADSMHQSIFEKDLAAGQNDFYLDRVLGVRGAMGANVLQTRGRTLYMRGASNSNFNTMGFAGSAFAGGPNNLGNFYTITVPGQTVSEVNSQRFNAPSHMSDRYNIGTTGVSADLKKFITYDNVAVTTLDLKNPGTEDKTFTLRAASPIATGETDADDELIGTRNLTSGSNNGLVDTAWSKITVGLKASGFTVNGTALEREVTVPAGGNLELSVVGVLYTDDLPDSKASFYDFAAMDADEAFSTGVTEFHRRWAQDVPYIDVPSPAVEKAIVYRWWGERYNTLDANSSGYVYQYPVTIEGVNLYQNSIVLTQPMHLQDTKWLRTPYLAYGQILNMGELSGSSAFLDSPGHTSWNNHYSQYTGTAGLEAYKVHGGGAEIAERFAHYFKNDGIGQLEHYDGNGDNLIAYDTNYMPGNDSDAITFGFPKSNATAPGARTIERPESAYVWGDFNAAKELYEIAGADETLVTQMQEKADDIRDAILDRLWSEDMRMFLAGTSHGAVSAASSNGKANPLPEAARDLIPAKESNLYDVYAENLIPVEDADKYVDGFRFLNYGDNFPIFPFYTANQYDRAAYGIGGSNNFSNINFTVQFRGVRSALRHYDPDHKYVTPEYAARLLDWMAWSIYPNADLRVPNQAEYYSNWNATTKTYNRNNPNHIMLGNMNYIYIEDMGGIQPRSDDVVELWPIDLGYDHFMVNNLRYHGKDVTIVWDPDGTQYGLGAGYSLFIDGERQVSTDELGHFTYDPSTRTVDTIDDIEVTFLAAEGSDLPAAVDTAIDDERVVKYLKTAGIDLTEDATNLAATATLSSSATQDGARPTSWRNFHTPGYSTSSMNYTPGAISTTERPVSLAAVNDGQTVNEPYWGNYGTGDTSGYIELDLGATKSFDNVKVWFVSDRQAGGYKEPVKYQIQVPDGDGGWQVVPDTFKSPKIVGPKFNEALFETVTADKLRVTFTNSPGFSTAISEIQVFDSGRDVPAVVNDPPTVTATRDTSKDGNLSTTLVATVTDDGIPDAGELTYGWTTVSKPEGAAVIFANAGALSTLVTGTVEGEYVFRFSAHDGELTTTRDVTVTLTPKEMVAEFGAIATVTTTGTASWEDHTKVNLPTTPTSSNPGTNQGWGTWGLPNSGLSTASAAAITYTWTSPVLLTSTDIYWYDDNGGTRVPRADTWAVEYTTDGETWQPVTLSEGSTYAAALVRNRYNHLDFEPVKAQALRVRIWGLQGSSAGGTGILRWRANGDTVDTVASPVIMRTPTGVVPPLPAELDVVYSAGERAKLAFAWQEITPEMVAETNVEPFVVYGTNSAYGLIAEAQIYVRPENSTGGISIQGAEQFAQTVWRGEQPVLPTRVAVSYNDGSRDNQAIGVEWDFDEEIVDTPGVYEIRGDLVLPDYVSAAGTVATTLTLTVKAPPSVESVAVVPASQRALAGSTVQLEADVTSISGASEEVTWTVAGAQSAGTTVSETGLLTIAADEAAAPLTVTATSVFDTSKSGSATVTVVTPPQVTATLPSGLVDGWNDEPFDVTLTTAADASVQYRLDGGQWTTYTWPVAIDEGQHTLIYRALWEGAVVPGSTQTLVVGVDVVGPTTTATTSPADGRGTVLEPVTVTFAATDEGVGVSHSQYRIAPALAWRNVPAEGLVIDEAGVSVVEYRSVDLFGNIGATGSVPVTIEAANDLARLVLTADKSAIAKGDPIGAHVEGFAHDGSSVGDLTADSVMTTDITTVWENGTSTFSRYRYALTATYTWTDSQDVVRSLTSNTVTVEVFDAQALLAAISGTPTVGETLTAVTLPDWPTTFQWLRDGSAIDGATGATYTVTADDAGSSLSVRVDVAAAEFSASKTSAPVEVAKIAPVLTAQLRSASVATTGTVTVDVTVDAAGITAPGGTVTVVAGNRSATGTVVAGVASIQLPAPAAGTHTVTVVYNGTKQIEVGSIDAGTLTVTKVKPGVVGKLAASKVTTGQSAKVTVTVTAAGVSAPTGKVTVKAGGKSVSATLKASHAGKVTVTLPKLAAGKHAVSVVYAGDALVASRTVSAGTLTVTKVTPTVKATLVQKSISSSVQGKVSVQVTAAGITGPTGTVTVTVNGKKVTKTLKSSDKGRVVVTLPKLGKGTYKVAVSYGGDAKVSSGKAASTTLTVK